jgi:hypothetical protein
MIPTAIHDAIDPARETRARRPGAVPTTRHLNITRGIPGNLWFPRRPFFP